MNDPDRDAHFRLGNSLRARGEYAQAVAAYERGLQLDPSNIAVLNNLGLAQYKLGRYMQALDAFRRASALDASNAHVLNNLGLALSKLERHPEACAAFHRASAADPGLVDAHINLGESLYRQQRFQEAKAAFETAVRAKADSARLWINLADCQQRIGDFAGASLSCRHAIELAPNEAVLHFNLGWVEQAQGRSTQAIEHYQRALTIAPDFPDARIGLLTAERALFDWSRSDELMRELKTRLQHPDQQAKPIGPLTYLLFVDSPADQLAAARIYSARKELVERAARPRVTRANGQRLCVGYLSGAFRHHPTTDLISEALECHDRMRVEIFAYSVGPDDASPARQRVINAVEHFSDLGEFPAEEIARRIAADAPHLLIDLDGYILHARSEVLCYRPAPIQIAYLGYPGTLGNELYDYVLTDRYVCPPSLQTHFTERFLYLPHCYQPADTRRPISPQRPRRADFHLPEEGFVFCCFNHPQKIAPTMFDVWMRVLRAVPGSVLWLLESDGAGEQNLRNEAQRRQIEGERLVFTPRLPGPDHLARQRLADLFLDTLPYNAHTTANDALYAGLPVLTCSGETFAGRVAGSLLQAIGLPELVTHALADYEAMALRLAREPQLLAHLRARLEANRHTHPLFDMAQFTRGLEDTLERAWTETARNIL
jgi:predicted O-linked N-acetylglucosamine transferase (SPINDLY family)